MSYYSTPYKYGRKTKVEIDAFNTTLLEVGDNVFNTDIEKEEFWTGNTWINDDCIEMTNTTGVAVSEGQVVGVDRDLTTATVANCETSTTTTFSWHVGVIYRGGANNAKVVVALKGYYKVKFTAATTATTRQNVATLSVTAGEVSSTGTKTGGTGSMGVIAETYAAIPADRLVYCWINSAEAF